MLRGSATCPGMFVELRRRLHIVCILLRVCTPGLATVAHRARGMHPWGKGLPLLGLVLRAQDNAGRAHGQRRPLDARESHTSEISSLTAPLRPFPLESQSP